MKLDNCPHCGGQPWFTYLDWQDDHRYVGMTLECCAVMSANIGWRSARDLSEDQRRAELKSSLTLSWNQRYVPEEE